MIGGARDRSHHGGKVKHEWGLEMKKEVKPGGLSRVRAAAVADGSVSITGEGSGVALSGRTLRKGATKEQKNTPWGSVEPARPDWRDLKDTSSCA